MDECIERKAVLYVLDEAVKTWRPDIGISKAEYLRIRYKNLPAADVRPVVRGKWVEHYEPYSTGEEWVEAQYGYECSVCGRWEYEKEPFCNCGAMMEES